MEKVITHKKYFLFIVIFIALAGFIIRFINMNYASLWADELYSMLSIHPGNSWYEILYLQRTYQPPGYFMVLWQWTKIFGYTAFSARLLSVVAGTAAIIISGYLGKTIKNEKAGIIMALLVAFNPTQILYSLEARFYMLAYCFAAFSLLLYWILITKKPSRYSIYFLKALVDAALCYFHHFGIAFVFAMFFFDIVLYFKEKDRISFLKKTGGYVLSALLYSPWFFWGLLQGMSTKVFWLKEISVIKYFNFSLGLPLFINLLALITIGYFLYTIFSGKKYHYYIFPIICLVVILIPLAYSLLRVPILVDRYSMVMAPAIYMMVSLGILYFFQLIYNTNPSFAKVFLVTCFAVFSSYGFYISFFNRDKMVKQPWREMAAWLKKQNDFPNAKIYSPGIILNNRFTIDFYIEPKQADHISTIEPGKDEKMYIVESSNVWKLQDSLMNKVQSAYNVKQISFNNNYPDFGNIYVCTKKHNMDSASISTVK